MGKGSCKFYLLVECVISIYISSEVSMGVKFQVQHIGNWGVVCMSKCFELRGVRVFCCCLRSAILSEIHYFPFTEALELPDSY